MVAPLRGIEPFAIPKLDLTKVSGSSAPSTGGTSGVGATQESSFSDKLRQVVESVNEKPLAGEQAAESYAQGKQNDLHGTMISLAQADVSLRMVANVRNRAIEAYREIMRMGS